MKEYVNEADDFDYDEYVFNPKEIIENGKCIIDYTGVENNKVYLVNKTDILTRPRPSWIPEFDTEGLKADDFLPVTVHDSNGNYYVQSKIKTGEHEKTLNNYHQTKVKVPEFTTKIYKMNLDVLSATIDFYLKRERVLLKEQGINKSITLPRALKSMSIERYNDMVNLLSFCSNYRESAESANIFKNYPHRSSSKGAKLQNFIIFTEQYQPFLSDLKDKKLDLNYQKIDYANSRQKGEETSYGESNAINDFLDQFGVRIKKQNGTGFKKEELKRFEDAINKVNDYYGNLKELSQKYDLILSYADNCHQYARSAIGLFSPYHQAIGVSFFDTNKTNERGASGDTILSHEVAHWLDNQKGQESADWYASNKAGTLENKIALAYKAELRKHINSLNEKSSITNESKTVKLGDYWYRTCECLARSVEQDYAIKHGIKIDEKGYLPEDIYKTKIQPFVQELLEENRKYFNLQEQSIKGQTMQIEVIKQKGTYNRTFYKLINVQTNETLDYEQSSYSELKRIARLHNIDLPATYNKAENKIIEINENIFIKKENGSYIYRKNDYSETIQNNKEIEENKLMNKSENNPITYFVKDSAEFEIFADFAPITGLTAEEAVAKFTEMKNKNHDCGIGINIPGDVVFDDPDGLGAIIFEAMPEIHKFSFYIGDTFVKGLKVKNEHSENVIKAFKGLDSAIRNSGIYADGLYDEPAFLFEKEKELGFVNKQPFTVEEENTLISLGFKKHEFHIDDENVQVIGGSDEWFEKANGNTVVKIWIEPEHGTNGRTFNWSNTKEKEGFNNLLWERGEYEMDYPSLMGCLLSITKRSISSSERPLDDEIITPKQLVPFLSNTDKDFYLNPGKDIKNEPFVKAMKEAIEISDNIVQEIPVPKSARNKLSGRTKIWFAGSDKTVQDMLDFLGERNMADFSLEQKADKQLYIQGYDNGGKLRGKMNVSEEEIEYLYSKLNSPEAKVHLNERFNQLTGKSFQVENKANDIINKFILNKLEKAGIEVVTEKEDFNRILETHSQNISQKLIMDWVSEKEIDYQTINKPDEILPLLNNYNKTPQELFMAISLDGSHKPISCRIVSAGTVNLSLVHPREVFREAIKDNAAALIVAHNHPSGNVQPSDQDIKTTKTLLEASKIIGIPILDHIITSPNQKDYYSFTEHGLIQNMKEDGVTYGFVYEDKIYLDPDLLNSRVAIHEYTHLWDNFTMRTNAELWDKGLQLFKNTKYWNEVISDPNYQDIKDDDNLVLSEIHSRICGEMAEKVFNRIAELDGEQVKLDAIDWNVETWNYISEVMLSKDSPLNYSNGLTSSDLTEFLSTPMKDFMNEKQITRKKEYTINLKALFNELYTNGESSFTDNAGNACITADRGHIRYTVQDVMDGEKYTGKATEYYDFYDNKSNSMTCCDGEKAELIETKTDTDGKKWYFFRSKDNNSDDTFCLSEKEFEFATTPVSITNDVMFEINDTGYEDNFWYNKQFLQTYNQVKEDPSLLNRIKEDFNSSIDEISYLGKMTLLASLHAVQAIELEQQVKNDIPRFLEVYGQKYKELYDDDTEKSYFVESEGSALFSKFFDESRSFKDFVRFAVSQRKFKDPFTSDRECAAVLIAVKELGLAKTLNINESSIPDMNLSDIQILMIQRKKDIEVLSEIEKELNVNPSNPAAIANKVTFTNSLNEINSEIRQEIIKILKERGLSDIVLEYTDEKTDSFTQSFRVLVNGNLMGSVSVVSDGFIGGKDNQGNHFNLEQPESTKMFKEYLERGIGKGAYKDFAPEPDKSFRYYLTQRPVSIGTQPDGFINQESFEEKKYDNDAGRAVYGYVEYDHELSEKEIKDFELSKPNPFREVIIEPSSDNKLEYPYVLYGRIGDMKGTPLSNYNAHISNANLEIKFNGFKSFEEAIALVKNNFKPLEQNISNAINDAVLELTGEIDNAFRDAKKQIEAEKKIEDEITEDLKVEIANRLEGVPLENQPVITRVKVYNPEDYGFEADGKLHILAEYESDTGFREDSLFNLLHDEDEPLFYNGNIVDVNPITPEKSGTIESYLENLKSMHEKENISVGNEIEEKARIVADYIIQLGMERSSDLENCHVSFEDIPLDVAGQKWVKEHYEDINHALAEHNDNELLEYYGDENEENEFNLYFCSNADEDGLNTLFRKDETGRWIRKPDIELEIEEKMNEPGETNDFTVLRSDSDIVKLWDEHPEQVRKGIYLLKENDTYITIDNSSGDCWTEEFDSLYKAFIYVNFAEGVEQIQELSEETAKNICMDYEITEDYFKTLEQKIEEINNLSPVENEKLFRNEIELRSVSPLESMKESDYSELFNGRNKLPVSDSWLEALEELSKTDKSLNDFSENEKIVAAANKFMEKLYLEMGYNHAEAIVALSRHMEDPLVKDSYQELEKKVLSYTRNYLKENPYPDFIYEKEEKLKAEIKARDDSFVNEAKRYINWIQEGVNPDKEYFEMGSHLWERTKHEKKDADGNINISWTIDLDGDYWAIPQSRFTNLETLDRAIILNNREWFDEKLAERALDEAEVLTQDKNETLMYEADALLNMSPSQKDFHIAGTMLENGEMSENGQFILNETSNGMLSKYIDKSEISIIDEFRNYAAVRITGNLQDRTPGNDYFSQLYNLGIKFCIERGYQLPVFSQEIYDKALEDYKIEYSENETFSMNGYSSKADEFYKALPEMSILQVQALLSGSKELFQTNNELLINNIYPHITVKKDGNISIDLQLDVSDKDPDNPVRTWRINDSINEKNRSHIIQKFTESIKEKEFNGEKVPDWVTNILNKKENTIANEVSENKNVSNSTNVLQKQAKPFDIIYNEEKGRVNIRFNPAKQNPYFNEIIKELKKENWHFAKSTRSWYPIKIDGSSDFAKELFEKYQNLLASEKEQGTSISSESVIKTATIQEDDNNPYSGLKFFDRNYEEGKDFLVYLNKNLKEGERPLSLSESQIILNALNHENIGLLNQRSHRLALDENNVLTIVEKHESEIIKIKTNLNELLKTAKEMADFSVAEFEQKLKSTEQNIKDIPGFDFNAHFKLMYENCLVDSKKVSENMNDIFDCYYNKFQEISSDDFLSVQAAKKAKLIENGEPYVEITFSESSDGKRLEKGTVWTLNEAEVLFPKKNEEFKGAYLKVDYTVNLFDKEGEEVSYSGTMDLGTDHPLEPFSDYLRMMCSYDEVLNAYETSWEKINTPSLSAFQKRRVENILYPHKEHLTERFAKLKDELHYVMDAHKTLIQPVIMDVQTFESSEKEVDKIHGKIKNLFEREINSSINDLYEYLEEQNSPELVIFAEHKLKNILQDVQYSESRKQNMDFDYGFWRESLKNIPAATEYDSIINKDKDELLKEIEEIKAARKQNGTSKLPVAKFTNFNYFPSRFVEYMKTGNPQGLSNEDKLMADSFIRENKLKFGCIEVKEGEQENCSHPDLGEPCETVRVSFKTTEYFIMPELKIGDTLDSDIVTNVIKLGEGVYQANFGEGKGNHFIVDQQIGNNLSTKVRNLFSSKGNRFVVENKLFDPYVCLELIEKNIIPPRDNEYLHNLRSYVKENPLACTIFKTSFRDGITEDNIGNVNLIDKWYNTFNNFAKTTFRNLSRNDQEEVKKWFGKLEISDLNPIRKTKLILSTLLPEKLGDEYRKLNNLTLSKTKNNGYPPRGE